MFMLKRILIISMLLAIGLSIFTIGLTAGAVMPAEGGPSDTTAADTLTPSDAVMNDSASSNATDVEVIVTFTNHSVRNETTLTKHNATVTGGATVKFMPVLFATASEDTVDDIEAESTVDKVSRNKELKRTPPVPSEPTADNETLVEPTTNTPWGVDRIGARDAAASVPAAAQTNVTVAVLDTGIDTDHPSLADSVTWGANTLGPTPQRGVNTAVDDHGHGTSVSGIIAGNADSAVVGVAPDVSLHAIKVLDGDNTGDLRSLIEGINIALEGPDGELGTDASPDVISMSLAVSAVPPDDDPLENAVAAASDHAVVIASAGNGGDGDPDTDTVTFPARYDSAIAVAAADQTDTTPEFSAEGETIELTAPGVRVETTAIGGGTTSFSGTSAAAPHVAGTAGLLIAAGAERDAVRPTLRDTAEPIGVATKTGAGMVQADAAVAPFTELPSAALEIRSIDIPDTTAGDPIDIAVTVTNTGAVNETANITATVDGIGTAERTAVSVPSGSEVSRTATIDTAVDDDGEYEAIITVTANDADTVSVSEPVTIREATETAPTADDYITRSVDDTIESVDVFDAIDDFRGGTLAPNELFDVIDAFRAS